MLSRLLASRVTWFLIGVATLPIAGFVFSQLKPTAKSAMGFVGFYEENLSLYTFIGDNSYSLKFPGDRQDFHKFADRLGLNGHKVSENEYYEENLKERWSRKASFNEGDKLRSIQFFSESH